MGKIMKKPQKSTHTHTHTHTQIVFASLILSVFYFGAYADDSSSLTIAIQNAKGACSGISDSMSNLKTMAGINTAVTAVGTVTAGVALGTGIAKSGVDSAIEQWELTLNEMIKKQEAENITFYRIDPADVEKSFKEGVKSTDAIQSDIAKATEASETLGSVRTRTLAGTAVLDTAGTIIAANNKVDSDLQSNIDKCIKSIDVLKDAQLRARTANTATDAELVMSDKIITACREWGYLDLSKINKRATGAAISGGTGVALASVGTVTSALANSDSVRGDNSDAGKQKEKNLNTASNILAGGATGVSAVATIFNAIQISAIKKAVEVADKCEEALR